MYLITLFSAPKPFTDPHIAMIQRNAIKSWTLLHDVEVILFGEEQGLPETALELGVKHLPNVARNPSGTPLISSMLQLARENSTSDLLCIINADMILMSDFVKAAMESRSSLAPPARAGVLLEHRRRAAGFHSFVLLSQRWDLDVTQPIEFTAGWQDHLRSSVHRQGSLHRPAGSDFFLFPRSCYADIPNFTIGRAGWDNWMIYKARKENWPVIDCTLSVMIVHQNHDYSHLPRGARGRGAQPPPRLHRPRGRRVRRAGLHRDEWVDGQPLDRLIPDHGLPLDQALRYGSQVVEGVAHAHERGIVHRDLKPGNIMITAQDRAKVLDFGLAKRFSTKELGEATTRLLTTLTEAGSLVGTVPYMAPEQVRGEEAVARSDVWALGVLLHERLAGERPFRGQTGFELSSAILNQPPSPLPARAPLELRAVIARCLIPFKDTIISLDSIRSFR